MSRKSSKKFFGVRWIAVIIIIAAAVGLTCGVMKLTNNLELGITEIFQNQDNLIRTIDEYVSEDGNSGNGLTWTINKDKSIKLEGTLVGTDRAEFTLGTVQIKEDGEYTLSGVKNASLTSLYLEATYTDASGDSQSIIGDISSSCTAELTEGTTVTIKIVAFSKVDFDTTIKPTFVLGDKAGRF